jgi:hypothetical protein
MKLTSTKIIVLLACAVFSFGFICTVSAQSTAVNAGDSITQPQVGSTLTVTLSISNVQNLAGIDSTLTWNPAVLTLTNTALNLGDSHSNSVLHGSNLNYNENNLKSGDIFVQETKVSGSYTLLAQSIGASNPGFTGSGTIATLTFNVVGEGAAGLSLQTDLADHPPAGQTANNINHQDTASSVTAVASGSSSTPTSSTPTATPTPGSQTSGPSSSPESSPTVPEFPSIAIITMLAIIVTATIALSTKSLETEQAIQ